MKYRKEYLCFVFTVIVTHCVVFSLKYEHISDCHFYNRGGDIGGNDNITFICNGNGQNAEVFVNKDDKIYNNCYNVDGPINSGWPGTIDFENCLFSELNRNYFVIYWNMHTLILSNVELKHLQADLFRDATNVTDLNISKNLLEEIPALLFVNAHKLERVDFSDNVITRVDTIAFAGAYSLQFLDLSHNKISSLDEQTLKLLSNLTWLNLSNNQLNTSHTLSNLKLLHLDLSHNNLTTIKEHAFDRMADLKELNLSFNALSELRVETFAYLTKLEHLNLRRINISSIQMGTFSHQDKLISLDLSKNRLKYLNFKLFYPALHDLKTFFVSNNQLVDLNGFRTASFPQLTLLDIQNNDFNCSYLENFMESINWERLRLRIDPYAVDLREPNIRGVKCTIVDQTNSYINHESWVAQQNANDSSIYVQVLLTIICIVMIANFIFSIIFHRDKLRNQFDRSIEVKYSANSNADGANAQLLL